MFYKVEMLYKYRSSNNFFLELYSFLNLHYLEYMYLSSIFIWYNIYVSEGLIFLICVIVQVLSVKMYLKYHLPNLLMSLKVKICLKIRKVFILIISCLIGFTFFSSNDQKYMYIIFLKFLINTQCYICVIRFQYIEISWTWWKSNIECIMFKYYSMHTPI